MKKRTNADIKQRMSEMEAMLHQSNISRKNLDRLSVLSRHADPGVAALANLVLAVGRVAPRKQSRWLEISSHHPRLFEDALMMLGQKYFENLFALDGGVESSLWRILNVLVRTTPSLPAVENLAQLPAASDKTPQCLLRAPSNLTNDQPQRPHVEIYTDGGCDPNPGPGGYGVVLVHPRKRAEASGAFRLTTNNRMEILAVIKGLEMLKRPCAVTVYSDSQYLVKAISHGWAARWKRNGWRLRTKEPAKNVDLWDRLLALCTVHRVQFRWIKGHSGNRENERCDCLCAAAKRQKNLPPDIGYEARESADWTSSV